MDQTTTLNERISAARAAEQQGEWDEALRLYEVALADAVAAGDAAGEAMLLRTIGRVHFERGDYDRSRGCYETCLLRAQEAGDRRLAGAALNGLAVVAQFRGELEVAEPLYARAAAIADELGDVALAARIEQNLGTLANTRGDLRTALFRYRAALERFRELGDDRAAARVLNNMGLLHVDVGEWAAAELSYESAHQLATTQQDWATQGLIDANRAELHLKRQQYERARESCDRALRTFTRIASDTGLAEVHKFYGVLGRETGSVDVAHIQFSLALRLARACGNPLLEAETESERALAFLEEKQPQRALTSLNRAFKIFCELDARREILDSKRRLERLEGPYLQALELWVEQEHVLQEQQTVARGERVAHLATALAQAYGLDRFSDLRIGAYLHDIGNVAVPSAVLQKPGPLTEAERDLVRAHPVAGAEALRELGFPPAVLSIVRHHHERWDGSGYPDGLRGEEIPLEARMVCIATVYDALTTDRSFRPAYTPEKSLEMMENEAGVIFEPALFGLFRETVATACAAAKPTAFAN